MPAGSSARQPDAALGWFSSLAGQGVLAAEDNARDEALAGLPELPWLWLGTASGTPPARSRRGLALRRDADGWSGDVRCGPELPLPRDTVGAIVLQHALDAEPALDATLAECERVLVPGGTLWIAALNPWTPYRGRWARSGLIARDPGHWQAALARGGFATDAIRLQWLGPHWRIEHGETGVGMVDRLRAAFAITVVKRVLAPIRPKALRRFRLQATRQRLPGAHARR